MDLLKLLWVLSFHGEFWGTYSFSHLRMDHDRKGPSDTRPSHFIGLAHAKHLLRAARQSATEHYLLMWISMESLFSKSLLCAPPTFCNTTCSHGWIVLTVNNRSLCHPSGFTEIPLAPLLAIHVAWLPLSIWPPLWFSLAFPITLS